MLSKEQEDIDPILLAKATSFAKLQWSKERDDFKIGGSADDTVFSDNLFKSHYSTKKMKKARDSLPKEAVYHEKDVKMKKQYNYLRVFRNRDDR